MRAGKLPLQFTYDDPEYVAAAMAVRAARPIYFELVRTAPYSFKVDIALREYEQALAKARAEEDRVLRFQATQRAMERLPGRRQELTVGKTRRRIAQ